MALDSSMIMLEVRRDRLKRYDSVRVRNALYLAVARTGNRPFLTTLCKRMVQGHPDYQHAAEALFAYGTEGVQTLLMVTTSAIESQMEVNHYVLTRLCRLARQNGLPYSDKIDVLVSKCLASRSKRCRMAAMSLVSKHHLTHFAAHLENLAYKASDQDEYNESLATLANLGCPCSDGMFNGIWSDKIHRLNNQEDVAKVLMPPWQTSDAVFAFLHMGKRGNRGVIDSIAKFCSLKVPNGEELVFISKALAEFARVDPELISTCLTSEDEILRGAAAWALGWASTQATIERCTELLAVETSPYVALCAVRAMAKSLAPNDVAFLKSLLRRGSPWAGNP